MNHRSDRWERAIPAFMAAGCLILGLTACHRSQPKQTGNIDSLRDALQRAAVKSFPSPTLSNHRFELTAKAVASKAAEITAIGKELNGTVLSGPASGPGVSLLIRLPANREAEFARRIGVPETSIPPGDSSEIPVMVDVQITPEAE